MLQRPSCGLPCVPHGHSPCAASLWCSPVTRPLGGRKLQMWLMRRARQLATNLEADLLATFPVQEFSTTHTTIWRSKVGAGCGVSCGGRAVSLGWAFTHLRLSRAGPPVWLSNSRASTGPPAVRCSDACGASAPPGSMSCAAAGSGRSFVYVHVTLEAMLECWPLATQPSFVCCRRHWPPPSAGRRGAEAPSCW